MAYCTLFHHHVPSPRRRVAFLSLAVAQIVVILYFEFVNLCWTVDRIVFLLYIYRAGILPSY